MQHIISNSLFEDESSITGNINDWNSRKKMLEYSGLDENYICYEIQIGGKLFFELLSFIIEKNTNKDMYSAHISEEQFNAMNKYIAYDLPKIKPINIHVTELYNGVTYHLILAYDIVYILNKLSHFVFVCLHKNDGNMNDILKFVNYLSENRKNKMVQKKLFSFSLKHTGPLDIIWELVKPIQLRNIDTVYIDNKIKQNLIDDITLFLERDDLYKRTGMPYKRCYLFYGLPGTGKTSLAKALATYFNKNIAILRLKTSFLDDCTLNTAMQTVPENTVVIIEDFDTTFTGSHLRQNEDPTSFNPMNKVSFSGILDILDGINSYEKQLIFITCNNIAAFNNIYMRAGRIDKIIEFGSLTKDAAISMLNNFCQNSDSAKVNLIATNISQNKVVPSELQTIILENNFDLDKISQKISKQIVAVKTQYQELNQKNTNLFQNHYGNTFGWNNNNNYV